jgi:Domain of unknown function (DUF4091)
MKLRLVIAGCHWSYPTSALRRGSQRTGRVRPVAPQRAEAWDVHSGLFLRLIIASIALAGGSASADDPPAPVRLAVTRDTWFSNVGSEADTNVGGSARLKLKSIQEMSLIDVDTLPLRGRVVRSATLYVRSTGEPRLKRVTVGSFGSDWFEGTATSYEPQAGSSTHNHKRRPDVPWTIPGSDLCSVMLGQGGTTWRMAEASPPDPDGWQSIAVDPSIVAARVAGVSQGFLLFDDVGNEFTHEGEKFSRSGFPNRFVYSRDSNKSSTPYLMVVLGPEDKLPPVAPGELRAEAADLPAGEAWASWTTPRDTGASGTIGFFATLDSKPLPRYLIPLAIEPGGRVRMHIRDLYQPRSGEVILAVRAVDGAGNLGPPAEARIRLSTRVAAALPGSSPSFSAAKVALPRLAGSQVAIIDELDKVHPVTGELIPAQPDGYLSANHLWDAGSKTVRLHSARNEFVGFQIVLPVPIANARPTLTFDGRIGDRIKVGFGRYRSVGSSKGPLPDPIVALDQAEAVKDAKLACLHAEVYIPHDVPAGDLKGTLTLESGGQSLALSVSLHVWDFTLPDSLSFLPEMNCYGLPGNERDFYRLAHRHRTFINRLPYNQNGAIQDGCAPRWDGKTLDWSAWDKRFGPLLDGSAFADLPRRGVPLDGFYLPLHENWPTPIEGSYNDDYWADRGFAAGYRAAFVEVSRQIAEHLHAKGWKDTLFQGFLNNKVDFKSRGWSRGSSPWLLDEPANTQDFWALRYFGTAFHEGINQARGPAKLAFRVDISRPQWQRDLFDGLLDYNVVGGAMRQYPRIVFDRKEAEGQVVIEYGGSNAIEDSNMQAVGWCLDSWTLGSDGVLPWQTIGRAESWTTADPLSLFYPSRTGGEPSPSIRLKAYRRGQQDVEYLTLLTQLGGEPRWAVAQRTRELLKLSGERRTTGSEDAGLVRFDRLRPQDEWTFRVRLGEALSALHPMPKRRLVDLRTPRRDLSRLTPGYVSESATAQPGR